MLGNQKGYALPLTLIVILVLFILGTVVIGVTTAQVKESVIQQERVQAHYLAYYGADAVARWIMDNPEQIPLGDSLPVELDTGTFEVNVEQVSPNLLRITSTGTVNGRSQTVAVELTGTSAGAGIPLLDMAVFAIGHGGTNPAIALTGSSQIIGPAGTNATAENQVSLDWSTHIYGDLFIGPGGSGDVTVRQANHQSGNVDGSITPLFEERVYPGVNFPDFPEHLPQREDLLTPWTPSLYYEINADGRYDLIHNSSSRTLTFDLQGETRTIRVRELRIEGDVVLKNVEPDGKLLIYVDEIFNTSGNREINWNGDPSRLTVILADSVPFTANPYAQYKFCGNVITNHGNVSVGAGSSFKGNIISANGDVSVTGAGNVMDLIYAPNGHVRLENSGDMEGAIVANTFAGYVDVRLRFREPDPSILPFDIFDHSSGGGGTGKLTWGNPRWIGE